MKTLLLALLFFNFLVAISAQPTIQWQKTFGGSDFDEAASIQQTLDGGYVVTCSTHGESIRLWDIDKGERIASYALSGGLEINGLFFAQTGLITILTRTDESQNRATLSLFKAPKEVKQALVGISRGTIERLSENAV